MWKAYGCEEAGVKKKDLESIHIIKKIISNPSVGKGIIIILTIMNTIFKTAGEVSSILFAAYSLSHDADDIDASSSYEYIYDWFTVLIRLADFSTSTILNMDRKIKDINPNSSFLKELLNLRFDGNFNVFEKKCDEIFDRETLKYVAEDYTALYCLIGEILERKAVSMAEKASEEAEYARKLGKEDVREELESGLITWFDPILKHSKKISFDDYYEKITDISAKTYKEKSSARKAKKLFATSANIDKDTVSQIIEKNNIIIKKIIVLFSKRHNIPTVSLEILLREGLVKFKDIIIDKKMEDISQKSAEFKRKVREVEERIKTNQDYTLNTLKEKVQLAEEKVSSLKETYERLSSSDDTRAEARDINLLIPKAEQEYNNAVKEYNILLKEFARIKPEKIAMRELETELMDIETDRFLGIDPINYRTIYDQMLEEFKRAGGIENYIKFKDYNDYYALRGAEEEREVEIVRKKYFERGMLKSKNLASVRIAKVMGLVLMKHTYNIIKYSISILPEKLITLLFHQNTIYNIFDEVLYVIAGLVLGTDFLATKEPHAKLLKEYLQAEFKSEDPFINKLIKDKKLIVPKKYEELEDKKPFNIFVSEYDYLETEKKRAEDIKMRAYEREKEKEQAAAELFKGGQGHHNKNNFSVNTRNYKKRIVSTMAISKHQIGKIVNSVNKRKVDKLPAQMSGWYAGNVFHNDISHNLKKKIHRFLCNLSANAEVVSMHFIEIINIGLALTYISSKLSAIVNDHYTTYVRRQRAFRGDSSFESFCEFVKPSRRFSTKIPELETRYGSDTDEYKKFLQEYKEKLFD